MKKRDFIVTGDGSWRVEPAPSDWELLQTPYYLHRFLTEVEDVLNQSWTELERLARLRRIVRRLILNSYWIATQKPQLQDTGSASRILYDELGYPLTVQTTLSQIGMTSSIHNHGTWGIVAILEGDETNQIWRRVPDPQFPHRVDLVGEFTLLPGDLISFTQDAVHSVIAGAAEPTHSFSLYGETYHSRRFTYDPATHTAKNF